VDDARRRSHDHGFGRNLDPIWDDGGIGSDHTDAGTEHPTTTPTLQGKED
jgi:hypothetical protein